jgi:hypothetical protein
LLQAFFLKIFFCAPFRVKCWKRSLGMWPILATGGGEESISSIRFILFPFLFPLYMCSIWCYRTFCIACLFTDTYGRQILKTYSESSSYQFSFSSLCFSWAKELAFKDTKHLLGAFRCQNTAEKSSMVYWSFKQQFFSSGETKRTKTGTAGHENPDYIYEILLPCRDPLSTMHEHSIQNLCDEIGIH